MTRYNPNPSPSTRFKPVEGKAIADKATTMRMFQEDLDWLMTNVPKAERAGWLREAIAQAVAKEKQA